MHSSLRLTLLFLCVFFSFVFPQYKPGCVRKMLKRKSSSANDKPTKRVRPVVEEHEDADDSDQEDEHLSNQVIVIGMLQNVVFLL